jgi:hypothetical protein
VVFKLQDIKDPKKKLQAIIYLLTHELPEKLGHSDYNKIYLNQIVIADSSKVYLVKDVHEFNKEEVFKPFKELCDQIAEIISVYNPSYKYANSLSSTLLETSHDQQYFATYLPKLTNANSKNTSDYAAEYLEDMLFRILESK